MSSEPYFGEIPGIPPGTGFSDRRALAEARVHRHLQAGITGRAELGAESIVLSGGYEDDKDGGAWILYTGFGGQDPSSRKQIANQELIGGNLALAKSCLDGSPVRVVRGAGLRSEFSPRSGYVYSGLFRVDDYWPAIGSSGFTIWRFLLTAVEAYSPQLVPGPTGQQVAADRRLVTVERIVRSSPTALMIKRLYNYTCQVCTTRLATNAGPYAEGAHIRPLGRPHDGPDSPSNILCLCPNHHVLLDRGGFAIDKDMSLIGLSGRLLISKQHNLDEVHLAYHRSRILLA